MKHSSKFYSRAEEGVLVGCGRGSAYRILMGHSKRVVGTKDVKFDEETMSNNATTKESLAELDISNGDVVLDDIITGKHVSD